MKPSSKRSRSLGAQADVAASALCVHAPAIDGATLAPGDIQWLDSTLTQFTDGSTTTHVSQNPNITFVDDTIKGCMVSIAGWDAHARRRIILMVVALHTLPGNAYQNTALGS